MNITKFLFLLVLLMVFNNSIAQDSSFSANIFKDDIIARAVVLLKGGKSYDAIFLLNSEISHEKQANEVNLLRVLDYSIELGWAYAYINRKDASDRIGISLAEVIISHKAKINIELTNRITRIYELFIYSSSIESAEKFHRALIANLDETNDIHLEVIWYSFYSMSEFVRMVGKSIDLSIQQNNKSYHFFRSLLGENHRLSIAANIHRVHELIKIGKFNEASEIVRICERQIRNLILKDPVYQRLCLAAYGSLHDELGEYSAAIQKKQEALEILLDNPGSGGDRAKSVLLGNISVSYLGDGNYEPALKARLLATEILEESEKGSEQHISSLKNLSRIYLKLDKIQNAIEVMNTAADLIDLRQMDDIDYLDFLNLKAEVLAKEKKYPEALEILFNQINSELFYELSYRKVELARLFGNIGALFDLEGNVEEATMWLKRSVNDFQAIREESSSLGTKSSASLAEKLSPRYEQLALLLSIQGRLAEAQMVLDMLKEDEQFDFIRRSAGADPRRTRIGYTPTEERWMGRYREIANRLAALGREEQTLQKQAKLGLSEEEKKRQAALAADLKVAQAAFESFLEQMRQEFAAKGPARSAEFAESSVKALAELQDLLKGLGDDVALLRIYLTDEQVNFLLTTPGVQLARNVKIKTQDLNRQVAELNRLLRDPKSDPLPAAQALYKLLLAPVEQDLQQAGARTVMLSLDGVLRYLPFGVLHDGQRYALQRWNLPVYTSVVRDRLRDAANANWQAAGLGVTRKHGNFDPLPGVRTEMSSIIRTGATGVLPGEVHLDEAFTAQRLKEVSQRRFPVVHVASHFQFSPGTEINSFLLLGDGTQLTLGDIRTQNYRFDDVDLLTLSACDTGLGGGRDQRGREIEGFGVIAQQQGAKAVLATLWKVADSSTATLMGDMYRRRVQGGLPKIEALRQAQMSMAAQPRTAHPFYWAPFVLMGNWK
jgi:CHAT domain-containing protein